MALFFGILWPLMHLAGWALMGKLSLQSLDANGLAVSGLILWFVILMMLSGTILLALNSLYDRGDLDLLVASPLRPQTIFTVRGLGVAANSVLLFAVLWLPFAHMGVARGHERRSITVVLETGRPL